MSTVKEFRKLLANADDNDKVLAWDPETGTWEEVTGIVYGGGDGLVKIYTDKD